MPGENGLSLLKDEVLKERILNCIDYLFVLFDKMERKDPESLIEVETCRVMILYAVSIIEAVLYKIYNLKSEKIKHVSHKYVQSLSNEFIHSKITGKVVISVMVEEEEKQQNITMKRMVEHYVDLDLIDRSIAKDLIDSYDIKNTFHLNKDRGSANCNLAEVEKTLKLLNEVITMIPKFITNN